MAEERRGRQHHFLPSPSISWTLPQKQGSSPCTKGPSVPLGGTIALPLPLPAGDREQGVQGAERSQGWTPKNLKTSSREILDPASPFPTRCIAMPRGCHLGRASPPSRPAALGHTHQGRGGRNQRQKWQRLGTEVPWWESGTPKATYPPQPTTQAGPPPASRQVAQLRPHLPAGNHLAALTSRGMPAAAAAAAPALRNLNLGKKQRAETPLGPFPPSPPPAHLGSSGAGS